MQQIADKAGVSRMAVSLALRNSPKISPSTSLKIQKIAEEMGYRPNPLVSALMTQLRHGRDVKRPSTVIYLTAYPTEDGWRRPGPFVAFREGAQQRAGQLGYKLEDWWLRRPGMTEDRLSEILFTRRIHGVIIAPLPPGAPRPDLQWEKFAAATIGYSVTGGHLHRASNDQYGTMRQALRELTQRGYRRIGLAMPAENDLRVKQYWSAGILVYQQNIPVEDRVPPLLSTGSFVRSFVDWLGQHRPDCIVSQERNVMRVLDMLGLNVPGDVGYAHLAIGEGEPDCAGMNQNPALVGAAAFDLVDAQLRRNERGLPSEPKTVLVPGFWVAGPTVKDLVI